jgi:thymidine kinase
MLSLPSESGWIEVIVGCMYAGKSEELIRRLTRAAIGRQAIMSFKPKIDDRSSGLASHSGSSLEAIPVSSAAEILSLAAQAKVVGIDEAQFLEGLAEVAHDLANQGKRVIIAGLDMDYRGIPFGPIPALLATAEKVDKLSAVCMTCGGPASRSQRIAASDEQVLIGAVGVYEARCRVHWSPQPVFSESRRMAELED